MPKPWGTTTVSFRVGELEPDLAARADGDPSEPRTRGSLLVAVARRDLERYYALLAQAMPAFSEAEASLIVDALNGTITRPESARLLWAEISDSLADGLAEKWGVDGHALVARLRALSPFEALAVADAVERVWHRIPHGEDLGAALRAVGLVRDDRR